MSHLYTCVSGLVQGNNVDAAWTQDTSTVSVGVVMPEGVRGKEVDLEVHPSRMRLAIRGDMALEGNFPEKVVPDNSFFSIEERDSKRMCQITLEKKEIGHMSWSEFFAEDVPDNSVTHKVRFWPPWFTTHAVRFAGKGRPIKLSHGAPLLALVGEQQTRVPKSVMASSCFTCSCACFCMPGAPALLPQTHAPLRAGVL